jgi:hypothetical protein
MPEANRPHTSRRYASSCQAMHMVADCRIYSVGSQRARWINLKPFWRMEESMSKQEGPAVPAPSVCEPVGDFEVVPKEVWDAAREKLLKEEKSLMKIRDRLIAKRRRLPVTRVDRE